MKMNAQFKKHPEQNIIRLVNSKNTLRILQVTDMHQGHLLPYSDERVVNKWIRDTSKNLHVDLVANTGDLFCYNVLPLVRRVITQFEKMVGRHTPWFFAWGNHDNENFRPRGPKEKIDRVSNIIAGMPNCLYLNNRKFIENIDPTPPKPGTREYQGTIAPWENGNGIGMNRYEGTYAGNYAIEIVDDLESDIIKGVILVFNSRRDFHVPPNARKWAKQYVSDLKKSQSKIPPMFAFYHVPNIDYDTLWQEGKAIGFKREAVCYQQETGSFHKFLVELGNVRGCFVGHDHVNDYYAEKDGIMYVYGRKTGKGSYGVDRKMTEEEMKQNVKKVIDGAKLININWEDNTWWFESLLINGTRELKSPQLPQK